MGIIIFPTLSALSEIGDGDGKRSALSGSVRFILFTTIPAAVGLIVIGRPLIGLLERGAFDAAASDFVYSTLVGFSLGLIVHSLLEIVARGFYADKDTFTPLIAALIGAAINLGLAIYLSGINPFGATEVVNGAATPQDRVWGLALANSIGTAIEVLILMWILRGRWQGIQQGRLFRTTVKTIIASVIMGAFVIIFNTLWGSIGLNERGLLFDIIQVVIGSLVGVAVFFTVAIILQMEELREFVTIVRGKQDEKPKRSGDAV